LDTSPPKKKPMEIIIESESLDERHNWKLEVEESPY
jgi:hypothetical protein